MHGSKNWRTSRRCWWYWCSNALEYGNTYSKALGSLWEYDEYEPAFDNTNNIIDFSHDKNNSTSFKIKEKRTGQTGNNGTKDVEVIVPLKYLRRTF